MLRPIDTQTIYQQTQELSNRQQVHNQGEHRQQGQFAHIMQKETELKKESVNELEKNQKIDNNLNKEKKEEQGNAKKNKKKESSKNNQGKKWHKETQIDIRI
ncbi:hypothetical protein [Cellulosilyticum sp. I15G10I2]|uniref:hypothetical protein n=1 Tax=Cellulosilyticum sp. I15G10I2 TaxID=1892843 RepID=UPI00085C24C0|nr:hypothetical protein [Cellulosilyticum sp. I15G10I2]